MTLVGTNDDTAEGSLVYLGWSAASSCALEGGALVARSLADTGAEDAGARCESAVIGKEEALPAS